MSALMQPKKSLGFFFIVILASAILVLGCQDSSQPSSPGLLPEQDGSGISSGHCLWGLWHVSLDPVTMSADVTPLRGIQFTCNVTQFMQAPISHVNMVLISLDSSSEPQTGFFAVDVTLRHPFPGLNQYRGFDVRGIMMADGSISGQHDNSVFRAGDGDTMLLNADGYTRWWNYEEFNSYNTIFGFTHGKLAPPNYPTCTVNPYKFFADGLEPLDPLSFMDPNSRATFSTVPGLNKRRYDIQFKMNGPSVVFDFDYGVDASWSEPDSDYAPMYPEDAFSLSANCNEAYMVNVTDSGSTAYYISDSDNGGELKLDIEIFDHQAVTSQYGIADEVASIWIEGDVLSDPIDVLASATILPGSGSQSSVYEVSLGSLNLTQPGLTQLFLTIESANVTTYEPQVPGGATFNFPDVPLASYLTHYAEIADHNPAPVPVVTSVIPDTGKPDDILEDVEVNGLNFASGAVVEFQHSTSAFTTGALPAVFVDSTLITLDLDLTGAPLGLYDVSVTNPDTQCGTLEDGFEVVEGIWWQSHMYNKENSGWNPTADLPDPTSLQQLWMQSINGFKFTTPVVADGKIFFTMNSTYWERPDMAVYCYDLSSGAQLWSQPINPTSAYTGWRCFSCPVWWHGPDGVDRLAVGGDQVYCFDTDTGTQLWSYDTSEGGQNIGWWSNQLKEYEGKVVAHSRFQYVYILDFITGALETKITTAAASEGGCAIVNDKVYINSSYWVECADFNTGAIIWSTLIPSGTGQMDHWIDPSISGNRVYVTSHYGYVHCLSIANDGGYIPGQLIWSWNDVTKPSGATTMMAGCGTRESGGVTRIYVSASSGSSQANVYCLEDQDVSASLIWSSSHTGSYEGDAIWASAPGYSQGVVYAPDVYNGYFYAFDASNGAEIWSYHLGAVTAKCGVSIVNDMIVLMTNQDIRVFKAP